MWCGFQIEIKLFWNKIAIHNNNDDDRQFIANERKRSQKKMKKKHDFSTNNYFREMAYATPLPVEHTDP